ncbi:MULTISPECIES: hypothetical protein [Rhizobium]|uniref:Uncharacterized protein n=1 Tax=Rhizobium tropici TaxID=398 RepID=A0A6P1BZY6_RHITR|nr:MULTISPECIES: hypothetical protein [Rhizobium]AGB72939.1 hypothetical protein RTCIAT899_CH17885 [Rhizobium tropici CIAT 899]MBB4241239.1 hypothetical protein [Rhizobium tropici]MBB5592215.1 hypothetical protein [Rhizobium tropici]MBB6491564.1 hypothetical protein [Rhizobium tropici]NEV10389.1 hypothetical protein [Rhizobium tropici]
MLYIPKLLFFISTILLLSQQARSEEGTFSGQWEQTYSNAGSCEKCLIGIVRHGTLLSISANNGWMATAETSRSGNAAYAAGNGRWHARVGAYSRGAFDILLAIRDEKLMMVMLVEKPNGSKQAIKAIFRKRKPETRPDKA